MLALYGSGVSRDTTPVDRDTISVARSPEFRKTVLWPSSLRPPSGDIRGSGHAAPEPDTGVNQGFRKYEMFIRSGPAIPEQARYGRTGGRS